MGCGIIDSGGHSSTGAVLEVLNRSKSDHQTPRQSSCVSIMKCATRSVLPKISLIRLAWLSLSAFLPNSIDLKDVKAPLEQLAEDG